MFAGDGKRISATLQSLFNQVSRSHNILRVIVMMNEYHKIQVFMIVFYLSSSSTVWRLRSKILQLKHKFEQKVSISKFDERKLFLEKSSIRQCEEKFYF
jgi:hypothetical protein